MATIATPNGTNYSPTFPVFPHNAQAVTPSDADEFAKPVSVFAEVGGDIAVLPWNSTTSIVLSAVPAYFTLPFMVRKVLATDTTATGVVAVY